MTHVGRESLVSRLDAALRAEPGAQADVLVVVRLRKLAAIGELMGEAAVRHLLAYVAGQLFDFAPGGNFVADLAAGTFAVVRTIGDEKAEDIAERMVALVTRRVAFGEAMLYAPANAGVCRLDTELGDGSAHLERALGALQQAMAKGPGFVELVCEARAARAVDEWEMRRLVEEAGLRGELSLEYQTIQDARGGEVRKVETLLRWDSPVLGRVGPDRFVPLLEESGLIRPVGEWILREACRQAREWRTQTGLPIRVALNISPVQLASADFVPMVQRTLAETKCDSSWVELEITEGAVVRDFLRMRERMDALASLGLTLAIDDFGAGHSSLGQLAQLPVHHLKMDRSLIAGLPDGTRRAGVVSAVVALADALGLLVTAEGVERPEQAAWLGRFIGMQCQGFLYSRPLPAAQVLRLLVAGVTPELARQG
jgi:EAL domain-containing protein (putative c-di-GMP-specific phosphodiesterase class I)/GGDEF domain-containing protein